MRPITGHPHLEERMSITRRILLSSAGALSMSALAGKAMAFENPLTGLEAIPEDISLASDAYVYGYPLVTMEMTRRVVTNVAKNKGTRGPMGSLIKLRQYPDAAFRDVTAPNADTLYTTAFFDVGDEPWVLDQPAGRTCSRCRARAPPAAPSRPS
jgi:hypothetical protein